MFQDFFKGHALLGFPLFALFFFVAAFAAVLFTATLRHRKDGRYESLARLPLADDDRPAPAAPAPGDRDV